MTEFQILVTILLAGFGFMGAILLVIWNRIEKLDTRINKLEMDMVEVKTILRMKECCMIQDEKQMKKAE